MQTDEQASTSSLALEQVIEMINQIIANQQKMAIQHKALEKNQAAMDDKITTILTLLDKPASQPVFMTPPTINNIPSSSQSSDLDMNTIDALFAKATKDIEVTNYFQYIST